MINEEIKDAVSNGKLNIVTSVVQNAISEGASSEDVFDSMMAAMEDVGEKFQNNDIYVPDMLIAAKTMQKGISVIESKFTAGNTSPCGKIIIGTVAGDMHDIGKNLVRSMLQYGGFDVIDLGIDVAPEDFVRTMKENQDCHIVALSALLTSTLSSMQETVEYIRKSKYGKHIKIMVGGAPVTQEFADQIGADAYTHNAAEALKCAKDINDELKN